MFLAWLLDQTDRDDLVGRFAKFIESDISNACLLRSTNTLGIRDHLFERHTKGYTGHLTNLSIAYKEYVDFVQTYRKL